jgi:PAS domain S-box-containing protein
MAAPGPSLVPAPEPESTERLRENQERLRLAMDAASMGAWDWDFATGEVHWSGDQEKLFGLTPGSFDKTFDAFQSRVHPGDFAAIQGRMAAAVAQKRTHHRDQFRIIRPDGTIRWMVANGRIYYDKDGNPLRMIGVNVDVTESRHAEHAIRESEKLAATGRLAATIAHEINNPLASMTNLLYLIEHYPSLDETVRAYATMASEELRRMSHIVKQTLAFHRQSATPLPLSLADTLESVLTFHERGVGAGDVQFIRRFEGEHDCEGFPGELRQAFSNLLLNAVQAVEGRGKIFIHVFPSGEWSRDAARRGTRVVIADNGCGIRPQDRAHIFEPFFTTKPGKGSGVGLWVTSGILRKHQATIRIVSADRGPRTGTTVSMFFPAARAGSGFPEQVRKEMVAARRSVQMRLRFSTR